jgi:hypothetical protein
MINPGEANATKAVGISGAWPISLFHFGHFPFRLTADLFCGSALL